jgi:hypothetical protein
MSTPTVVPAPLTPDIVAKTPVVGPPPEPVKFTPEQQSKIDAIVREAMGRAAADTRAELAREKAEKERLAAELKTALLAAAPDASEADKLRLQLEQERKSKEELSQSFQRERTNNVILSEATKAGIVNPALAYRLIDAPPALADGSPDVAAIAAAIQKLSTENPNLVYGQTRTGSGSAPSTGAPPITRKCEDFFGRGSNAAAANRLAISNPAAYRSLRAEAVRKGLVA